MSNITDMNGNPVNTPEADPTLDEYEVTFTDGNTVVFEGFVSLSDTWFAIIRDPGTLVYACPLTNVHEVRNLSAE